LGLLVEEVLVVLFRESTSSLFFFAFVFAIQSTARAVENASS